MSYLEILLTSILLPIVFTPLFITFYDKGVNKTQKEAEKRGFGKFIVENNQVRFKWKENSEE